MKIAHDGAPAVSVIVPTHDREDLLGETLESVRAQTFAAWECLVVDDGSTDGTEALVRRTIEREPRFRYVRQERSSAANARNRGLALARGRYVTFLDSDDLFAPDKLAWQCAALDAAPDAVLVYGDTFQFEHGAPERGGIYQDGVPRPAGRAFEALLACSSIYAPMARAEALRAVGGFDASLPSAEDWDAWIALSRRGLVLYEPRVALRYRVHAGNKSSDVLRNLRCARHVARKHLRALPLVRRAAVALRVRRYFARVYGPRLVGAAYARTAAGDWRAARELWRALAALAPRRLASRSALAHALWSLVPTGAPPPWERGQRRAERDAAHDAEHDSMKETEGAR